MSVDASPQYREVCALMARANTLTEADLEALGRLPRVLRGPELRAWDDLCRVVCGYEFYGMRRGTLPPGTGPQEFHSWLYNTFDALLWRDLIPTDMYDEMTWQWRVCVGVLHPDDPDWSVLTASQVAVLIGLLKDDPRMPAGTGVSVTLSVFA